MQQQSPNGDAPDAAQQALEKKKAGQKMVLTIIRALGAFFLLAGAACFAGLANAILPDPTNQKILGAAFCLLGISDMFVVPLILAKAFARSNGGAVS